MAIPEAILRQEILQILETMELEYKPALWETACLTWMADLCKIIAGKFDVSILKVAYPVLKYIFTYTGRERSGVVYNGSGEQRGRTYAHDKPDPNFT